jgi:hypothetical protein
MLRPGRFKGLRHRRTRRAYALYARSKLRVMAAGVPGVRRAVASRPTGTEEISPSFEEPLRALAARGVPVRFLYGTEDGFYTDEYRAAAAGALADVLDEGRGVVELALVPGRLHGLTTVAAQDAVVDDVVRWAAAHPQADDGVDGDGGS